MDVQLIPSSVLELPTAQRADVIVHDGTTDLRTWPGPGPDRELVEHYGSEMSSVLERERDRLADGELPIGGLLRLHRGRLHCEFLLWIATRPPEDRGIQAPAPSAEVITKAVKDALHFAGERRVDRIAFGPLGAGPQALDDVQRLVLIAKAANAYYDECYQAGKPANIEEVLVCHPFSSKVSEARRALGRSVKMIQPAPTPSSSPSGTTRRRSASGGGKKRTTARKPVIPTARLSDEEIGRAKASAELYDRAKSYEIGDFFVHPKFGVGRVQELTPEGFIIVLFEGGAQRRLLHRRG